MPNETGPNLPKPFPVPGQPANLLELLFDRMPMMHMKITKNSPEKDVKYLWVDEVPDDGNPREPDDV